MKDIFHVLKFGVIINAFVEKYAFYSATTCKLFMLLHHFRTLNKRTERLIAVLLNCEDMEASRNLKMRSKLQAHVHFRSHNHEKEMRKDRNTT